MRRLLPIALVLFALESLLFGGVAKACGTCAAGDPSLTSMGFGQPVEHRFRASATFRLRREEMSVGLLRERRLDIGVAYAPSERVFLAATLPLVQQHITYNNLAEHRRLGLGDADLRARIVLFRERRFAPRHLLSLIVGTELPTATRFSSRQGGDNYDLRPGSRTWDPLAGLAYSHFGPKLSVHLLSTVMVPLTEDDDSVRGGLGWRTSLRGQWQPLEELAFSLGSDLRIEAPDHIDGTRQSDSGGTLVFATAGVLFRPSELFQLQTEIALPVARWQRGGHREGLSFMLGVMLDV